MLKMACDFHFSNKGYGCPKVQEFTVEIEDVAFERMMNIAKKVSDEYHTEVAFFLLAMKDNPFKIIDILIPEKQKLTGASAVTDDGDGNSLYEKLFKDIWLEENGRVLIGTGHSHGTMGVFFSGTDDSDLKSKYHIPVNVGLPFIDIVVNAKRQINCRVVVRTECDDFVLCNDVEILEKVPTGKGRSINAPPLRSHLFNVDEEFSKIEKPEKNAWKKRKAGYGYQSHLGGYYDGYDDDDNFYPPEYSRGMNLEAQIDDDLEYHECVECGKKLSEDEYYKAEPCDSCGEDICEKCIEKAEDDAPKGSAFSVTQCKNCRGEYGDSGKYRGLNYNDVC